MTITIQFSTSADIGSAAIRWFTHSPWSHVDVVWPDGRLFGARSDTDKPGVQFRRPGYAKFSRTECLIVPCSETQEHNFYAFLWKQENKPYDMKGIIGFAADRDWRNPGSWFCSELVTAAAEAANIVRVNTPVNRITPGDAYLLLGTVSSSRMAA